MSRSNDGKDTGAERGMQPEKPRDANEVCQKKVDLEMIRCSGSTRIKEMKRERVVQLKSLEVTKVNEADDPIC